MTRHRRLRLALALAAGLALLGALPAVAQFVLQGTPSGTEPGTVVRNIPSGNQQVYGGVQLTYQSSIFTLKQISGANAAQTINIPPLAGTRAHVGMVVAVCSAGTAKLDIGDGVNNIYSSGAGAVGATNFERTFQPMITGPVNTNIDVAVTACGVGNTSTLWVLADRW